MLHTSTGMLTVTLIAIKMEGQQISRGSTPPLTAEHYMQKLHSEPKLLESWYPSFNTSAPAKTLKRQVYIQLSAQSTRVGTCSSPQTGTGTQLTSIPDGKASKFAGAPVIIRAALDQGWEQAMPVEGSVKVRRVATHVAQEVAHACPHCRL